MRNHSTLIYLVNSFQSELNSFNLIETRINSALKTVPNAEEAPPDRIIENILNFARSYEVYETENAGYVEMIMN